VPGLKWLDINYPFNSPDETVARQGRPDRTGIRAIAITPHAHAPAREGAFNNPDAKCQQAVTCALASRSRVSWTRRTSFWPGQTATTTRSRPTMAALDLS
jgi:hypothetical protein